MMLIKSRNDRRRAINFSSKFARISASLMLLQMTCAQLAFAQDGSASSASGTSGLPTSGSPESWPWMQVNPDGVKHKDDASAGANSSSTSSTSATSSTSPSSTAAATPSTSPGKETPAATSSAKSGVPDAIWGGSAYPEKPASKPPDDWKLDGEHAKAAGIKQDELRKEPTALKSEHAVTVQPKSQTRMIFGRIEQLTAGTGAKFPVLKAQTAKMDFSGQALKGGATDNMFTGQLVRSFPTDMSGSYGGVLQLSQIQLDPLYYQLDAAEAKQTADLMRPGLQGKVNMVFQNMGTKGVTLEPAKIFFSAPMTQSRLAGQMSQMGGMPGMSNMAGNPGMQQMMQSMMTSMPYIWYMSLGSVQGTGISGNTVQTNLVKNDVRQLSPTVIEQQNISQEHDTNPKTGSTRTSYSESVVRFTRYNASQQYVQAVAVDYSADKRFLRKMVFAGYVTKGVSEQMPDPMGGLSGLGGLGGLGGLTGGAGGAGGAGGLDMGALQKMLQGGSGGTPQNLPGGLDNNPFFKGLFGH